MNVSNAQNPFDILEISVQLTALDSFFGGASLIHPSFVDVKDAEKAGAPILALPSQNEPDMVNVLISYLITPTRTGSNFYN